MYLKSILSGKLLILFFTMSVFWGCGDNSTEPETDVTKIAGIVTNAGNGAAIAGAAINDGTNVIATSGQDGNYSVEINAGTYTFTCTASGYIDKKAENIVVEDKKTTTINFALDPINIVEITSNITSNTTWKKENVYVIKKWIYIQAALTIEAGTVIKFESSVYLDIDGANGGLVIAQGSALEPIIFTSIRDDVHGGDTNEDGNLTQPAAGDWRLIEINGTNNASIFSYCQFLYGGGQPGDATHTIDLNSGTSVNITNCTFAHNKGGGATVNNFCGVVNAYNAGSGTVITENTFYDNDVPLLINGNFDIDDSNVFHNPDTPSQTNIHNAIFYDGYRDIEGNRSWQESEVPFVIFDYALDIESGNSLTLGENIVIKLNGVGIDIDNGLLIADAGAANPIIFTSYKDDSYNGDSNGDGAVTSPAAGDWCAILIDGANNSSSFDYCRFLYGGGQPGDATHTIDLNSGTSVSITNCTFVHNKGGGTTVNDFRGVVDAYSAGSGTVISGNTFYDNDVPILINGRFDMDDSNIFHNPSNASEINTYNGIFYDGYRDIEGNHSWEETEVPFVIFDYDLDIQAGNSLTLANNVIIKLAGSSVSINYQGDNLLNYDGSGVWFTSYKDDTHGGDTNGDGAITTPADGDWDGIYNSTSHAYESWSNILYDNH
jgi:hypothetical protein